jgi:hypothetical protein
VFIAGGVVTLAGLDGIGGFVGAAAWITTVSQGGQYLAGWLARHGLGGADRNVVLAVAVSATINALAISGVAWIHPLYVAASLLAGCAIFLSGAAADARALYAAANAAAKRRAAPHEAPLAVSLVGGAMR